MIYFIKCKEVTVEESISPLDCAECEMLEYDVFISYPHADVTQAKAIVVALRASGLNIWFDESDIADFTSITHSITHGLARSKILLAYYSSNYTRSRACQWELTAAFLAAQQEGDPRQRVLIVNPEGRAEHLHPVELRDALFRKMPTADDAEALDAIAASIANHVASLNGHLGEIRALTPSPWYGTWKGVGSNRFVGRLPELWRIHSGLHAPHVPIITNTVGSGLVQLYGTGGMGKSLLAEEYALRFGSAYRGGIFWLEAYGHDNAKANLGEEGRETERTRQIRTIAETLGLLVKDRSLQEVEGYLGQELQHRGQPFLWVVDDIPSGMAVENLRRWFAPHPLGQTLITTRSREHGSLGTLIRVDILEPDEAYQLLTSRRQPADDEEMQAAKAITKELGYHALAVDVAGGVLPAFVGLKSFRDFLDDLRNPSQDELELANELIAEEQLPNGHEKSIAATLLKSIKLLDEVGLDFLRLASVLAVAPIPARLVASVFAQLEKQNQATALRTAARAMQQAELLALAESTGDSQGSRSVHTLISRTVRFRDPQSERRTQFKAATVEALNAELSKATNIYAHHGLAPWVIHGRALAAAADDPTTVELLGYIARYDYEYGDYPSAATLWRRQLQTRRSLLGEEHSDTLRSMNNLAEALRAQGSFPEARTLQEQELNARRRLLGEEHLDTLSSMNNLAQTLRAQGNLVAARQLQEKLLNSSHRMQGEGQWNIVIIWMNNLAAILYDQADLAGAQGLQETVLDICRQVLGEKHEYTLKSTCNLANTLRDRGDFGKARVLQEGVLARQREVLGEKHPDTLVTMSSLVSTLLKQGNFAEAQSLQEQVLTFRQQVLGKEHPTTLSSMSLLAGMLYDQDNLTGARELQEQVLTLQQKALGEKHPSTLLSMNNLANTLHFLGEQVRSQKLHEQALASQTLVLGREHPDTTRSAWNLFCCLEEKGDFNAAIKILDQHLSWLINHNPANLGAYQRKIRERLRQRLIAGRES